MNEHDAGPRMIKRQETPVFSSRTIRIYRSWSWVENDFAEEFDRLAKAGAFLPNGISETIWSTRSKFVLKVPTSLGFDAAYKSFLRIRNFHQYLLRPSACAAEALNYVRLAELGFPLPDLLAVGETRCGFLLKNAFMISRFADGFRNGLDFARDGIHLGDMPMLAEFCRGHLSLLAKLHDKGIVHRGFTPGNLLYRRGHDGMEFLWIDVASCRRSTISTAEIATDMFHLFRYLNISPDIRRELQAWYLNAATVKRTGADELFDAVEKRIENRMKI